MNAEVTVEIDRLKDEQERWGAGVWEDGEDGQDLKTYGAIYMLAFYSCEHRNKEASCLSGTSFTELFS